MNYLTTRKIYGLGEKFRPFVKNGVESVVWNSDSSCLTNHDLAYAGVPLVYSSKNWAALVNSGFQVDFEIGAPTSDALSILCHEEFLDLFLLTGSSIKDCVSHYTLLTGRIKGVPDLAYGTWLNRLYYHNVNELWEQIKLAQKNAYPLDVITLDPKWLKDRYVKSCNFTLNESAFGNFAELISQIKKANLEVCFWINPYIQADGGAAWKYLNKNNLLLKNHEGQLAHPWTGAETQQDNNYIVDFTNPEAYHWYKEQIKRLFDLGVRFVKPDYGDGVPKNAFFNSRQFGSAMRQWFIYLYLRCCYEASLEYFGDGQALIFARPGFIGTQKFVGKWSGDSYTDYAFLKTHLWAGLGAALAGHVIWGTDIGGFAGPSPSEDLYQRWTQFGMLTPLSRYHGIGAREPWLFSGQTYQIALRFAHFKRSLLPYFKICEQAAVDKGWPIIRPLVLEFQDDKIAQLIDDQYLLGSQIMVCPVLTANTQSRQVYLPEGEWYLWGQHENAYQGQRLITLDCPADQSLIFVKGGSLVVTIKETGFKMGHLEGLTF
ncbi:TIM-barrel domain-containing protein [Mycoplasma sp. ATU-Cv-508]|uniref:TIM-barrel domain-containing protein n=1 Tax=Mycoplasma sp. ATU-Cv-508 TaxID=2048001 RepID=UPI000FDD1146